MFARRLGNLIGGADAESEEEVGQEKIGQEKAGEKAVGEA